MENDKQIVVSFIMAVIAVCLITVATNARADNPQNLEKCFGVVKAGQNDCETNTGSCAPSVIDASPTEWIYLPVGVCNKLVGGSTTPGNPSTPTGNSPNPYMTQSGDNGAGMTSAPIMKDDTVLDGGAGLTGGSGNSPTPQMDSTKSNSGSELNRY